MRFWRVDPLVRDITVFFGTELLLTCPRYTFDVLGELYYGEMFGFMKDREDHNDWIWALDKMIPFVCFAGVTSPLLRPFVYAALAVLPIGKAIAKGS